MKKQPIKIRSHQVKHFKKLASVLMREIACLDVSPCGTGKTHMMFALAAQFGLDVLAIAPKSTKHNIRKYGKIYGVNIIDVITYQSLRGNKDKKINHPYLVRSGKEEGYSYQATEAFINCVKKGVLLVFDEYQNVQNDNSQLASAHALVKALVKVVKMGYKSRIILMSGTPCVDKKNVTATFKMLGIILSNKLYNYSGKKYRLIGIQEAYNKCYKINKGETHAISCRPVNSTSAQTICYELYVRVLKPYIASGMPKQKIDTKSEYKNYYMWMPKEDLIKMEKGLNSFKSCTNYNDRTKQINVQWSSVGKTREAIDNAKIKSTVRIAKKHLVSEPKCKIIIYCTFRKDINEAKELLTEYKPLILNGTVSKDEDRLDIMNKFQADNNDYRIIIAHPKVGGVGIELDDKFGNRPRIELMLPSYHFIDQFQATCRIRRAGTMSNTRVYFMYSKEYPNETSIINSMAHKSKTLKNMIYESDDDVRYPGEYDNYIEPDVEN